tara:strand:+ start:641 stop:817 length:177 start_codon:yes stop_codon:yes gene_type:complete
MKITKKQLEQLYNNYSNKIVCEKLGITNPTLISLLKKCDIKTKGSGNRNQKKKIIIID